jgi:hypothetical protein
MKKQQIQQQKQITAYEKKVTYDIFLLSIEWLEKYIEIVYKNEFPDWENRKQIRDNLNITRTDIYDDPEEAEDAFSTQLLYLESNLKRRPIFVREALQEELYKWIDGSGINANNCPEKLKNFLFGINEILEGKGEKIRRDVENEKPRVDANSPEYMEQMKNTFALFNSAAKRQTGIETSLAGRMHKDIEIESRFSSSNVERGKQIFQQIAVGVAGSHETGFHFFPQQGQQNNLQNRTNSEIIQDIRQNPQNWRIDEIIVDLGENGQENVLIHQSAQLDDYNQQTGKLNFEGNAIYQANRFSTEEQDQINQALNISQQQTQQQQTSYKWSWEK